MFRHYNNVLAGLRRRSAIAVACLVASGVGEGAGIAALLPFIKGTLPGKQNVEYLGLSGDALAITALVTFLVAGTLSAIVRYFAESQVENVRGRVEEALRLRMTAALVDVDWVAFQAAPMGESTKAVLQDGAEVGRGAEGFLLGIGYLGSAVVFVAIAFAMSWELTLATLAFGAVTVFVYRRAMKSSERRSSTLSQGLGDLTHFVTDLLANFKFYKASGAADRLQQRAARVFGDWRDAFVRVEKYPPATRSAFDIAGLAFIGAVLGIAVLVAGASPVDSFVFLALFYRLAPKLQQAQQRLLVGGTQLAWWRDWLARYEWTRDAHELPSGSVRFDAPPVVCAIDLTYAYPDHEPAVRDVSWELGPGGCLALVGASGSGKTTILDLVLSLLSPTSGSLELDGTDLTDVDRRWWQRRIGLVMQDTPIFQGTLLDNIAWFDDAPDRDRALRCAEQAHMGDVVAQLADGLDTPVGHRGSRLSGGQRQRVALARALYREPWLLVLDEATSALDAASEVAIKGALSDLKGQIAILLVSHQLRIVDIAEEVLVLEGGRVVERGTWDELTSSGTGMFRQMLDLQSTGSDESAREAS